MSDKQPMDSRLFGYWQVDFAGTRVALGNDAYEALDADMRAARSEWEHDGRDPDGMDWTDLTDIYGSAVRIFHSRIEAISFKSPTTVAAWQKHSRVFNDEIDRLDPEGAAKKPEAWEAGSDE